MAEWLRDARWDDIEEKRVFYLLSTLSRDEIKTRGVVISTLNSPCASVVCSEREKYICVWHDCEFAEKNSIVARIALILVARCAKLNYHLLPSFLPSFLAASSAFSPLPLSPPLAVADEHNFHHNLSKVHAKPKRFIHVDAWFQQKEGVRGPRTTRDTSRSSCPRARAFPHLPPSQVLFNYPAFLPALLSLSRSRTPSLSGLCFIGAHDTTPAPALASNLRDIWRLKVFFNSLGPEKKATKHYTGSR